MEFEFESNIIDYYLDDVCIIIGMDLSQVIQLILESN